ncbi:MAG TPA: hypothetical protein VKD72_26925, partial [Gemmataceae bacterium]|nr:hypothetical protein [Gemmataceae bacterium]
VAREWVHKICSTVMTLMERPGRRIAAAEVALERIGEFCAEQGLVASRRLHELSTRSQQARADVQAAMDDCMAGPGFSLFGGRTARILRNFLDHAAAFARHRLAEDLAEAVVQFFRRLQSGVEERLRDLSFCRQRLAHLRQMLETPGDPFALGTAGAMERTPAYPSRNTRTVPAVRGASNVQVILPYGETEIETAASRFLAGLGSHHWVKLEEVLQMLVLDPLGGLYAVCQKTSDLLRQLAGPLIDQTSAFLSELLPVTDVAQAEQSSSKAGPGSLAERIRDSHRLARPLVPGETAEQKSFLLVPTSPAGTELGERCKEMILGLKVLRVAGQASDLTISREQGYLRHRDLAEILRNCHDAYRELKKSAQGSPHARFDIPEWMPLDV